MGERGRQRYGYIDGRNEEKQTKNGLKERILKGMKCWNDVCWTAWCIDRQKKIKKKSMCGWIQTKKRELK